MTDTNQLPQIPDLTNERIDYIADLTVKGMPDGIRGFLVSWGWRQFAKALMSKFDETMRAYALQARAQVQGMPVGMVQVGWQQRYICPEEGPSSWQDTCSATAAILAKKANHEVRATYAFSTTPQPARAQVHGSEMSELLTQMRDFAKVSLANPGVAMPVPDIVAAEGRKLMQGETSLFDTLASTTPVQQPAQATQAEVTPEEVMRAAKEATAPEWQDVVDGWHMGLDLMKFTSLILALRPVQVPMTDDERCEAYLKHSKSYEGHRSTFMRGVWAAEAHHGITAQDKKEDA